MARLPWRVRFVAPPQEEPVVPVTDIVLSPTSHLDTLEDGEIVGVLSHNVPGQSADWAITGNSKYRLSASSGVTINLLRNGSSPFTAGVSETVTISAAVSGQAVPYGEEQTIGITELGDVTFIQSFQVSNWGASTSPGRHRKGLVFKKGDVPSTATVAVYRGSTLITAQFDNRNTWSDGSLKSCVVSFIDDAFTAGETRDYDAMMVPGSSFDNTGTLSISDITSNTDFKVDLSSFTQYNGTSTTTRGDGTASIAFNTIAATATRLTKRCSGAVYEEWDAWGFFVNGDTTTDDHLDGRGYVGVWKDENGDIVDYDYAFVIKQDWWSIANKYRLNYTAVLKDGSTTIETYSTLQHPYNARFATRYKGNDNNYCKRFSKNSMPTLFSTVDKAYWISTGLIPPYDTSFTPTSNTSLYGTYNWAPFAGMNHSTGFSSTGAYMGRGALPNCDVISFMRQTAADFAMSRKNADAGLHCPRHFSSNRTRTRPGDGGSDTANTICALILTPTHSGDFTADGLPTPVHAYRGGSSTYNDSYVSPLGGTGAWYDLQDNAHLPNFCQYVYMIEGDNIMLDTMLSFAASNLQYNNGNDYNGRSKLWFFDVPDQNVVSSISTVNWGSTVASQSQISNRAIGWSILQRAVATGLCPDDHEQANYWDKCNEQSGAYFAASMVNLPADQEASGFQGGGGNLTSPWMENIIHICAEANAAMTEDANFAALAAFKARVPVGCIDKAPALASAYRCAPQPTRSKWASGGTNNYFDIGEWFNEPVRATVSSSVWSIADNLDNFDYTVVDGDLVRFCDTTNGNGGAPLARPAEITATQLYYVVNASGGTFQLSATQGGSPISFGANADAWLSLRLSAYEDLTVFASPNLPGADSYAMINSAALIAAANRGDTAAQALLTKNATLCAPINKANWVTWHYQAIA